MPRFAALLCILLSALPAKAEEPTWPLILSNRLEIQTDRLLQKQDVLSFNPLTVRAQVRAHEQLMLDFEGTLLLGTTQTLEALRSFAGPTSHFAIGNVTAGLRTYRVLEDHAVLAFGVSLTVPPSMKRDLATLLPLVMASLARMGADMYRYVPLATYLRFPLQLEVRFGDVVRWRSDLTPTLWLPRDSRVRKDVPLTVEHDDELLLRTRNGFCGGIRFQATFMSSFSSKDESIAAAIAPFIGYEPFGRGVFTRVDVMVPLTRSMIDFSESETTWVMRLQLGVTL